MLPLEASLTLGQLLLLAEDGAVRFGEAIDLAAAFLEPVTLLLFLLLDPPGCFLEPGDLLETFENLAATTRSARYTDPALGTEEFAIG
jgi:hypothetical protein